jgi:hypothetical protein
VSSIDNKRVIHRRFSFSHLLVEKFRFDVSYRRSLATILLKSNQLMLIISDDASMLHLI